MSRPPTRPAALAPTGHSAPPVAADNGATDSDSGHNAASSPQHGTRPTNHTALGASKLVSKPITPTASNILRIAAQDVDSLHEGRLQIDAEVVSPAFVHPSVQIVLRFLRDPQTLRVDCVPRRALAIRSERQNEARREWRNGRRDVVSVHCVSGSSVSTVAAIPDAMPGPSSEGSSVRVHPSVQAFASET